MVRSQGGEREPLEKPFTRRQLIRELATLTGTQAALAKKYSVAESSITAFKQRHATEIAAVQAAAEDEFAGLLIAQKEHRLAAYDDLYDQADRAGDRASATRILRNVAEEMGHLPSRVTLAGEIGVTTRYVIDGVGNDDLT